MDKETPNKNAEVMFRGSTDNGKRFGDKINLCNSSKSDSVNAMIANALNTKNIVMSLISKMNKVLPVQIVFNIYI